MFQVDAPQRFPDDHDGAPDIARIVVSEDSGAVDSGAVVADHPVLLADGLPLGPTITGTRRTKL